MSFRRGRSTEGAGLPATAFRVVGDRHFDPTAKADYVLRDLSGTLTWVKITPEPDTLASLGAAQSTSGAGKPDPLTRLPGDLHYDTTAKIEYVLTGVAAGSTPATQTYAIRDYPSQIYSKKISFDLTLSNYRWDAGLARYVVDWAVTNYTAPDGHSDYAFHFYPVDSAGSNHGLVEMIAAYNNVSPKTGTAVVAISTTGATWSFEVSNGSTVLPQFNPRLTGPGSAITESRAWTSTDEYVAAHTHDAAAVAAADVTFTPSGTLAATNVQDAITEVAAESQRAGVAQPTVTSVVVSDGGTAYWKVISDTTGILITRAAPVASPSVFWLTSPDGTRWRLGATTAGAVTTTSGTPAADDAVFSTKNPLLLPTNDPTYVFALTVTDSGGLVTTEA